MDNSTGRTHCEGKPGRREKKKQRPSSEMLKRMRTKECGGQALIPKKKFKREAPVEQLWERNREGRKETYRKPSTQNRKEGTGNQAGNMEKRSGKRERNRSTGKASCEAGTGREWKGRTEG